jgi:hypothetical protein
VVVVPFVTVVVVVPALALQAVTHLGSLTTIGVKMGAPAAEKTAEIVQFALVPPLGGKDQLIGNVNGAV